MSLGIDRMIVLNQFQTVCTELFTHLFQIIFEQFFENLYDAKCGLMEGTMFKDLNLIFCGVRGK